ncbi:hypothetical protein H0H87_006907 [Tephrocybe sp. NHM501043]|nr:hypothetical protein H0H87_006907 [Tephrocybe sp. NHM501043]
MPEQKPLLRSLQGFHGGGGTFGVVLKATSLASPPVALQTMIVSFTTTNSTHTKDLWTILTYNGLKWVDEGWGGFSMSNIAILVNPILSADKAVLLMDPLITYDNQLKSKGVEGASVVVTMFPTF